MSALWLLYFAVMLFHYHPVLWQTALGVLIVIVVALALRAPPKHLR